MPYSLERVIYRFFYYFVWAFGYPLFRIFFNVKITGRENIKALEGPLIIALNHCSVYDMVAMVSIPPDSKLIPVHFAVAPIFYWRFLLFMLLIGAFPVRKGLELGETLKRPLRVLKNNGVVAIFPEGKRRHFGRKRKGRRGAAFLALKTNSPILPIYIEGLLGFKSRGIFKERRGVKIVIGEPFRLEPREIKQPSDLNDSSDFIVEKIYELRGSKNKN